MSAIEFKQKIKEALKSFFDGELRERGVSLFDVLGYNTSRQNSLENKTWAEFKEHFVKDSFSEDKALVKEWSYVDILFQISKDEVTGEKGLFDSGRVDNVIIESYLFFTIELKGESYSRTQLSNISREINKLFPMPVMVIFKYNGMITFSIISRRINKKDGSKDVLEKVTQIKDINISNPHRAHIEILHDLSFGKLQKEFKVTNFVELHNAWQKTLDTKELNKRFYQELSNWYFWAMNFAEFPDDIEKDKSIRNATNLIRLITRIIFIWFIKEKGLVPEKIFNKNEVAALVKDFCKNKDSNFYYNAILQNLFFGTLNQNMKERRFAVENDEYVKKDHGVKNLYRFRDMFLISEKEALKLFADVPFLNGGLFDCLDKEETDTEKKRVLCIDGFSRNPKKRANVPDFLFFGDEGEFDLNATFGTKNKKYKVRGLIEILSSYKFTITENTPIEEEIALDPELLGKVFENLLASYNPETSTTARKQTGSFYTPREIVNYMVDESLIAYLDQKMKDQGKVDCEGKLRNLISYSEEDHGFDKKESALLISAVDSCKILDPACGSGAFPMGILHKLVHVLHKIDPKNEQWKKRQIDKVKGIDDAAIREKIVEDIENAFENNELDYGRKLYLIENCIYGVDIQPIAVQIAKLRFFISLIIDQKRDDKKDNHGIRALPNLETKFVAANTLIGLEKPVEVYKDGNEQGLLIGSNITELENELKDLRHKYFTAKTRKEKLKCQEEDKKLREEIAKLLISEGWDAASAKQIVSFDPYDQNASSPFFDPEWMFGVIEGFDIVIGNPPYVKARDSNDKEYRKKIEKKYKTTYKMWDIYIPFIEKGLSIKRNNGILTFIIPDTLGVADYTKKLVEFIESEHHLSQINFFPDMYIFENATVRNKIIIIDDHKSTAPSKRLQSIPFLIPYKELEVLYDNNKYLYEISGLQLSLENSIILGEICIVSYGLRLNSDKDDNEYSFTKSDLISEIKTKIHSRKYVEGKFISKYRIDKEMFVEWNTERCPGKLVRATYPELYNPPKLLLSRQKKIGTYCDEKHICDNTIIVAILAVDLKEVDNMNIRKYYQNIQTDRQIIEKNSCQFDLKYILSIINSKTISYLIKYESKGKIDFYPDDWKKIPIKNISLIKQQPFIIIVKIILFLKVKDYNSQSLTFFESVIDAMVYDLYFAKQIKEADAEILKHLNNIPELKDDWSDDKKVKTIEKVYKELSDPAHPVSIAMERQKSVEEVRIIEGL